MKIVAQNHRARFDYEIVETIEAGMMLTGPEVKSCREGHISLAGAYVLLQKGKAKLRNVTIARYRYAASTETYEPARERELLLKTSEIDRLASAVDQKGMTLVPLEVRAGKFIKILIGLGRGKKKFDKRASIKKREVERKLREGKEY
ncbi:SsrA-binding protein [Candidatus Peribacteria bacterium RIFCSPHIGHO2_02_FULL_53_20]|nr:MAG: SsrA-binding protein [Candidatus Peribacteria bacterium RIFCSPHIGHO2_02_FULL_53_20]OGJ65917.1 MAG: SsrA-binding protein [Candidatus Peribacteria bacterium RIFCSPLOWO2_01_FULL_53_10]OGJ75009.1 MAG: SsrA-binding protein [Candidatus Peribacteria bacterium RIFCSPLOWO2_12_FULL_53_10]